MEALDQEWLDTQTLIQLLLQSTIIGGLWHDAVDSERIWSS